MSANRDAGLMHQIGYFERIYADDPDPWQFESSWYERRKYTLTVAALPAPRYQLAYEPGCANGALTELLAPRCDRLVAADVVVDVVERARRRVAHLDHVEVESASFPTWWPSERGDLVVLSEIAYYLTDDGLSRAATELERWLRPGGDVVAVHYRGETDYPRSGPDVGRWLDGLPWLSRRVSLHDERFDLGVWRRT